ncbi:MAG: helix-turn-helix transcriptional regulator [Xanthobacteraceae bacterium]
MARKKSSERQDLRPDHSLETEICIRAAEKGETSAPVSQAAKANRLTGPPRFPETSPFYSRAQVLEIVPVSYASLWSWMRTGKFPQARELGPSGGRRIKIGWLRSEVHEWIAARPVRQLKQPTSSSAA